MPKTKGSVRTGQLITTYGVGSLVAVGDESFMIAGIDRWPDDPSEMLHEPRLERVLRVHGFLRPPASDDGGDIPVVRFPTWCWCPSCKRLDAYTFFGAQQSNTCNLCDQPLVPSRFIVACPRGHIDDFPFFSWVHSGSKSPAGTKHRMRIDAGGATASLRDILISCECGQSRTMDKAFSRAALQGVTRCKGKRPWLGDTVDDCEEAPRTLQRGASNVWFSILRSAISIPPWSEGAYKVLAKQWSVIKAIPSAALGPTIDGMRLTEGTAYSVHDLVEAVERRKREESGDIAAEPLREQEYQALIKGRDETSREQDFVCERVITLSPLVAEYFDEVMQVRRLREVRVLEAFSRVNPAGPNDSDHHAPLAKGEVTWLPAIEVRGEGVFLRLDEARLANWEVAAEVSDRVAGLDRRYRQRAEALGQVPDRVVTPRFVLLHTLAHVLIDQWALDCGYSASALRERLYSGPSMNGILIYTATSDSAGSLGGVVAQAEPARLELSLREAIARASWCSSDPLCIETTAAGTDALNLAACHACTLLPETSCEEMNLLLDRALLVGLVDDRSVGFFADLVD